MSHSTHAEIAATLQSRWPEHRVAPSLSRVAAFCDLLGSPQQAAPVIQITGTNGKGSTAIMIDALLRAMGLRTGRFSSPHLVDLTERICIDGRPIDQVTFDELVEEVMPYIEMVDSQRIEGVRMTFFEVMTGLAFAAFAQAPVDVMILEVGLGGTWDATNVADAKVAVLCPIDLDHTHLLGNSVAAIAQEKAGIIKPGSTAVIAAQQPDAASVLLERCSQVGARPLWEGRDFALLDRTLAVGGQSLRLHIASGTVEEVFLPLFGAHMAENAVVALAAVEAFMGGRSIDPALIRAGFADVVAPARLEVVRRSPTVVLDTCHNPHGIRATLAAVAESFDFHPLIGVVAMMRDKDIETALELFEEHLNQIVVTQVASTTRGMPAGELGEMAADVFGADRVHVEPGMAGAIDAAVALADQAGMGAGVLIAGSVIAAGEARALLVPQGELASSQIPDDDDDDAYDDDDAEEAGTGTRIAGAEFGPDGFHDLQIDFSDIDEGDDEDEDW